MLNDNGDNEIQISNQTTCVFWVCVCVFVFWDHLEEFKDITYSSSYV